VKKLRSQRWGVDLDDMNDARGGSGNEPVPEEQPGSRSQRTAQDMRAEPGANRLLRPSNRLTSAPVRWGIRVLDGERSWGSIDIRPGHYGLVRHRLVVSPPGITRAERRLLRLSRAWPAWGAALWLISEMCLSSTLRPWAAFGIATMAYLGMEAVLTGKVGVLRPQVRTRSVDLIAGHTDQRSAAIHTEIKALANTLENADTMRAQGQMTAIDHEAASWKVYDRLGPGHPEPREQPSI